MTTALNCLLFVSLGLIVTLKHRRDTVDMSPQLTQWIDSLTYEELLRACRNAPAGDPLFQGASGRYVSERMNKMRAAPGGAHRGRADVAVREAAP